ncbi:MAG: DUF308 domain-containing protein [Anaerococcus sp.]|nr:DUF308 domain-containing protein [Anaerococcus sp.]
MINKNNGFSFGSLLIGILYLLAGFLAIRNPLASNSFLVMLIVFTGVFDGIFEIALRNRINKFFGKKGGFLLFAGVVSIIFAGFILFNFRASVLALPIVFAIYLIVSSIFSIVRALTLKSSSRGVFWGLLIINVLGLLLGLMLIKNPLSSFMTIASILGFYFILAGIRNIIHAF